MNIDTKRIGKFLLLLNEAEYIYMGHSMSMRNSIERLISTYKLSKDFICDRFKIKEAEYKSYIKGDYNYSVKDMACLNALFIELELENIKENVPVQVNPSTP